jgi:hypothetical protein
MAETKKQNEDLKWLIDKGWQEHCPDNNKTIYKYISSVSEFQLSFDKDDDDKIILSSEFVLKEYKKLESPTKLEFLSEHITFLMPMDIYLVKPKYHNDEFESNHFKIENFIYKDNNLRKNLLQAIYKMERIVDLCFLNVEIFKALQTSDK